MAAQRPDLVLRLFDRWFRGSAEFPIAFAAMTIPVQRFTLDAGAFHQLDPGAPSAPEIWINQVKRRSVVLGSRQRDPTGWLKVGRIGAQGVDVAARRSGGGLVFIEPETSVWVDVILPVDHPRWQPDVARAFLWVGQAWATALKNLGLGPLEVAAPEATANDEALCFAGVGAGEVSVAGSKTVGLSQRRWRTGARFQGLAAVDPLPQWGLELVTDDVLAPYGGITGAASLPVGAPFDAAQLQDQVVAQLRRALEQL